MGQNIIEKVFEFGAESERTTTLIDSLGKQVSFGAGSASVDLVEKTTHFSTVSTVLQLLEDRVYIFFVHGVFPTAVRPISILETSSAIWQGLVR